MTDLMLHWVKCLPKVDVFWISFRYFESPSDIAGEALFCEVSSFPKQWKSFPGTTCKILYCMGSSKLN